MPKKIIFAEDCLRELRESGFSDEETIKQWVKDNINKSVDYINKITDGSKGVIVDEEHRIFIKFYVAGNAILVDEIREEVCIV